MTCLTTGESSGIVILPMNLLITKAAPNGVPSRRLGNRGKGMTWQEACNDRRLQNLPYKIEINRHGQLIMSPTRNQHGIFQGEIAGLFKQLLPSGQAAVEVAIDCGLEGTYVADVVWMSAERRLIIQGEASCSIAPEICVEVWSPSNSTEEMEMKRRLYIARGALEFWYCDDLGNLRHFDQSGEIPKSKLCPVFPARIG